MAAARDQAARIVRETANDEAAPDAGAQLADQLRTHGRMRTTEQRKKPTGGYTVARIPPTAADTLAEGEFNRFYIRALCRRAIEERIPNLIIYQAKDVQQPRPDSEWMVGTVTSPPALLEDLRTHQGTDTMYGLPGGPNSGLSVQLP